MAGTITHYWDGTRLVVTSDSGTSSCDLQGAQGDVGVRGPQGPIGLTGDTGAPGASAQLTIGTVTNGSNASATITGTSPNYSLNLVLPHGASIQDIDFMEDGRFDFTLTTGEHIYSEGSIASVTGVKGSAESSYRTGAVNITAANVGAVPTSRTVNGKALSSNITLGAADVSAVPTTRTVNSKALSADISLTASDVGAVPTTRTINSKALSSNITLTAANVGAVPTTRTVNSKALSANITLTADDVGALTKEDLLDLLYPVGSIYMSISSTNQIAEELGGTWTQIKDRFLLAAGDSYASATTGGSADAVVVSHTHSGKLTVDGSTWTMRSYSYGTSGGNATVMGIDFNGSDYNTITTPSAGVSGTGKNIPPYYCVNMWRRDS